MQVYSISRVDGYFLAKKNHLAKTEDSLIQIKKRNGILPVKMVQDTWKVLPNPQLKCLCPKKNPSQ